ncbi:MAG: hypothetical protein KAJ00_01845, partial [Deltaproteobacteria bacterium]|nr:hypothetical protein [Deltaproteobacteria bacterium]
EVRKLRGVYWQSKGQGFEPPQLHQEDQGVTSYLHGLHPLFCAVIVHQTKENRMEFSSNIKQ